MAVSDTSTMHVRSPCNRARGPGGTLAGVPSLYLSPGTAAKSYMQSCKTRSPSTPKRSGRWTFSAAETRSRQLGLPTSWRCGRAHRPCWRRYPLPTGFSCSVSCSAGSDGRLRDATLSHPRGHPRAGRLGVPPSTQPSSRATSANTERGSAFRRKRSARHAISTGLRSRSSSGRAATLACRRLSASLELYGSDRPNFSMACDSARVRSARAAPRCPSARPCVRPIAKSPLLDAVTHTAGLHTLQD